MISNILTTLRLILSPIILYLLIKSQFKLALILTIIAAITDLLDGYLARKLKKTTALGKFLDPLADKVLTVFVLLALLLINKITLLELLILSFREIVIALFTLIALIDKNKRMKEWTRNNLGKFATVAQYTFILIILLNISILRNIFLLITAVLSIASTISYLRIYKHHLKTLKSTTIELLKFILVLLLGIFYEIFYIIFTPLTIYPTFIISNIFFDAALIENALIIDSTIFKFIPACIAASAYLLLAILILTTKGINFGKCLKLFIIGSLLILSANILRLEFLIFLYRNFSIELFNTIHLFIWKVLSSIYVVLVWLFITKYFKIKEIPIYSTLKEFYNLSLFKKRR